MSGRLVRLLLFLFLPALLLAGGIDGFLEATEREALDARLDDMAALLSDLKGEILRESDRTRLAQEAHDAFARADTLDDAAFAALRSALETGAGPRRVLALRAVRGADGTPSFRAASGDPMKMRSALEKVARHLAAACLDEAASDLPTLRRLEREAAPFARILFGRDATPARLADRRGEPIEVRIENRDAWLLWDFAGPPERPAAIVLVLIDRARYAEEFGRERLVARADARHASAGIRIRLSACPAGADARALLPAGEAPDPPPPAAGAFRAAGKEALHAAHPLAEDDERVTLLLASSPRAPFSRTRRLFRAAAAALLLLLLAALPPRARAAPRRVPLRARLAGVFLLSSALPVLALFYLGRHHARDAERSALREAQTEIARKIASAGESQAAFRQSLESGLKSLCEHPDVRRGDFARFTSELEAAARRDGRILAAFDRLYALSPAGETLLGNDSLSRSFLAQRPKLSGRNDTAIAFTAKPLLLTMIRDVNGEAEPRATRETDLGFVRSVFLSASKSSSTLSSRGRLGQMMMGQSLSWTYLDVIADPSDRAFAGVALVFDGERASREILRTLVGRNHDAADERVRIGARSDRAGGRSYPSAGWFDGDLSRLVERASRRGSQERAVIEHAGRKAVALAAPLPGSGGIVLAGVLPHEGIDAARVRAIRVFALLSLLSLLAALSIGAFVARKFLAPVRLFGEGVAAITRGDLTHRMELHSPDELGALGATFNRMVAGLEEKERMSRYVSEFVRSEVARGALSAADQAGAERKVTILFCNVPGFAQMCAEREPSAIVELLNAHFEAVTPLLQASGGVIDKFIGDAVMAVFRADETPGALPDEARATAAALAIRSGLSRFNAARRARGRFGIDLAVGINSGNVIQGSMGSREERVDLTVIGDNVNVAARLEAMAKGGTRTKIYVSQSAASAARSVAEFAPVGEIRLKGKAEPLPLFEAEGPLPLPRLAPLLSSPHPRTRITALLLLPSLGGAEPFAAAVALLSDPDPSVRVEAARALARFDLPGEASDALRRALDSEGDPRVRACLVAEFGRVADDARLVALLPFLADPDGRVRANATEAIGRARDRAALVAGIRPLLADGKPRARANAAVLLHALGDPSGFAALLAMARADDPGMRASGAWGIGEVASRARTARPGEEDGFDPHRRDATEALHELLDDFDRPAVRQAVRALGRVGERSSVARLVRLYHRSAEEELRLAILTAIDEIGSYGAVLALKGGGVA